MGRTTTLDAPFHVEIFFVGFLNKITAFTSAISWGTGWVRYSCVCWIFVCSRFIILSTAPFRGCSPESSCEIFHHLNVLIITLLPLLSMSISREEPPKNVAQQRRPTYHDTSKHIDIKYYFIRDCKEEKKIYVEHIRMED